MWVSRYTHNFVGIFFLPFLVFYLVIIVVGDLQKRSKPIFNLNNIRLSKGSAKTKKKVKKKITAKRTVLGPVLEYNIYFPMREHNLKPGRLQALSIMNERKKNELQKKNPH